MSILTDARQYELTAVVDIVAADIVTTAVAVDVLELPQNSVITFLQLVIDVAFDTGTTADIDIGDSGDPNRYSQTLVEIDAVGIPTNEPGVLVATNAVSDYHQTDSDETHLIVTPTLTGIAMVAGEARLIVKYYVAGRQNENRG